jgi:4-amino-4-deoxy-L-arabinose transferase-like glycosyltransferase
MPSRLTQLAAPPDRPLPLYILYPLFFVGVYLAHHALLALPWFWDEAGYYIPAALDFFRTGSLIPHSTITNAHPPLPSILLAAWWHIAGLSIQGTRTFLCMIAAAALLGVFSLARSLAGNAVAIATTLLTAIYPIWFAQSTLAHADLFAAAFSLWALAVYFKPIRSTPDLINLAALFSLAVLSKETAIVTPLALALYELAKRRQAPAIALVFPVLPLVLWYTYHHHVTGFTFGNPEFLRYNATANLSPARILLSLWHRLVHLFFHMNMWVPVACTMAILPIKPLPGKPGLTRQTLIAFAVILAANAVAFSILGGALLTRYLLPMYPLILLVCVATWHQRLKQWPALAALSVLAFIAALFINPPYSFAPEDNLTYADFINLHQRAIHLIDHDFPYATVLTAWPATTELQHPELGYTTRPIRTTAIDNFSLPEIQKAAQDSSAFDTALVFSTKWVPPATQLSLTRHTEQSDTRFFDFHRDLSPEEIAQILHGQILWQARSHGEWAAILRFPRSNEAHLSYVLPNPQPPLDSSRLWAPQVSLARPGFSATPRPPLQVLTSPPPRKPSNPGRISA